MEDTTEKASPEAIEALKQSIKETNEGKRRDKLRRQVQRAHEWRVQVWAQSELRIRSAQASLEVLGSEPVDLFEPDFNDDALLHHYADMTLSK